MPKLYLMVGLPRSGKSTWTENNREGKAVLSADTLRVMLHGSLYNPKKEKMVWEVFDYLLRKVLEAGTQDIIIDNTNTSTKSRRGIIQTAIEAGYQIICVWVKTPAKICYSRTENIGLLDAIDRMEKYFEVPRLSEGFEEIIEIIETEEYVLCEYCYRWVARKNVFSSPDGTHHWCFDCCVGVK